ncbi:MAG: NUDIX domain-containing protein [bacterium]
MNELRKEEISAGGVVYRKVENEYEFLIGKHSGYHKWVLPKGLVEKGENKEEAAVREVAEEVGVVAKIVNLSPLKTIEYWYFADLDLSGDTTRRVAKYAEEGGAKTRIHKKVFFYLMEIEKDLGAAGWEMEERKWINFEEGKRMLAFDTERLVWEAAGKELGCL